MGTHKPPMKQNVTKEDKKNAVTTAATDATGRFVRSVESVIGTSAITDALRKAQLLISKEVDKFIMGNDGVKYRNRNTTELPVDAVKTPRLK